MATDLSQAASGAPDTPPSSPPARPRHPVRWVALAVAVLVLLPAVVVLGRQLGRDNVARSPLIGEPAPDLTLPTIDGGTITTVDLTGRPYVVNFWASWCVPCREEHAALQAFHARYQPQGVELLGISFNDPRASALRYRNELGGTWPLLEDPDGRAAVDFGVLGPPETFIVDEHGIVAAKITGAVQPGQLEGLLAELAAVPR